MFSCHSGIGASKETVDCNLESRYSFFFYCYLIVILTYVVFGVSALRVIVKKVLYVGFIPVLSSGKLFVCESIPVSKADFSTNTVSV